MKEKPHEGGGSDLISRVFVCPPLSVEISQSLEIGERDYSCLSFSKRQSWNHPLAGSVFIANINILQCTKNGKIVQSKSALVGGLYFTLSQNNGVFKCFVHSAIARSFFKVFTEYVDFFKLQFCLILKHCVYFYFLKYNTI